MQKITALAALAFSCLAIGRAQDGGLYGSQLEMQTRYRSGDYRPAPGPFDTFNIPLVQGGSQFQVTTQGNNFPVNIFVADSTLSFDFSVFNQYGYSNSTYAAGDFNGYVFTLYSPTRTIVGVTIDPTTTLALDKQRVYFTNSQIFVNVAALPVTPTSIIKLNIRFGPPRRVNVTHDLDGDGRADFSLYRPASGFWYGMTTGGTSFVGQWGTQADIPVPNDYDGDGKTDYAVFRPSSGTWYVQPSSNPGALLTWEWGTAGDIPLSGDFDGDGKADLAVFRPSNDTWYIRTTGEFPFYTSRQWGGTGDVPIVGDFDGDGKADIGVFREASGFWLIIPSSDPNQPISQPWGQDHDIPVIGDFDGDGKTDFAVFRPSDGTWYILQTSGLPNPAFQQSFGQSGDVPLAGDFDGDGKSD